MFIDANVFVSSRIPEPLTTTLPGRDWSMPSRAMNR